MSYGGQTYPTAREATREHGLVAGGMTGAWGIANDLATIIDALQGLRPTAPGPQPDPSPCEIEHLAVVTLEQHARTSLLLVRLRQILGL